MEAKPDSLFGALAVQEGFASEAEVEVALVAQKDAVSGEETAPIGQILLEMGALNQAQIEAVLAAQARYRAASGVPETLPDPVPAIAPAERTPVPAGFARFVQESGEPPRINGEIVRNPRLLKPGDLLQLGGARFRFEGDLDTSPVVVPVATAVPGEGASSAPALEKVDAPASEPAPAPAAEIPPPGSSRLLAVLAPVDRLVSRILPRVHNHRKYLVLPALLGLAAVVLPWRIASNGNTVVGLQGPGWLTFWLLAVAAGGAALTRVARPVAKVEWLVIASSSGLAFLAGLWKFAFPPAYASGRGIGLHLTIVSAALVHGVCWLIRRSGAPAVAEDDGTEPAAVRLARWAGRLFRDITGKSAKEKAGQIQKRDELLAEIGRAALAAGVDGPDAQAAREAVSKLASAEASAGGDLKARALLKAAEAKAKRALGKLGRHAVEKGVALPGAEAKVAELRALEEKLGGGPPTAPPSA